MNDIEPRDEFTDYRRLPLWKKRDLHQQEQRRRAFAAPRANSPERRP
jgi:hypothetical protein